MPFNLLNTEIEEVKLIEPKKFPDERGYFLETYKKSNFTEMGINGNFNQHNHSFSVRGTLRGLHFQNPPYAQGKLVRVMKGKILDVAVDVRKDSPTYGKYVMRELSEDNFRILWVPEGFAHGFLALEDSIVLYKATSEYNTDSEAGLIWNDRIVNIGWPKFEKVISEKDKTWPELENINSRFNYKVIQ